MTLRLAPYNDAMRLGQGFNSYTHELCIDQAVKVKQRKTADQNSQTSQVVSYSARFVEKLSDVVESMNVSYSSAIKKGTVEISGNTSTVDETTFKSSQLNAVVAVKVVNQTISTEDESVFQELEGDEAATNARFNEIYGDSYISGFIEGGDFTGIVSIKVMDGKDVKATTEAIKSGLSMNSRAEVEEFVMGPSDSSARSSLASALKDTETSISISWVGGAQIKEATRAWDVDSMYAAAAAFPSAVAQCPQRTWAILTPYKANRSFVRWSTGGPVRTMQYDLIASYTAELFDSYMDYKLLLKEIQNIISNRKGYRQRTGVVDAIDTNLKTLLSVRGALRDEQTKIVEAVGVLSKDPSALKRQGAWSTTNRAPLVKQIIEKALGKAATWEPQELAIHAVSAEDASSANPDQAQKVESDDGVIVGVTNAAHTPVPAIMEKSQDQPGIPGSEPFNFDTLMPPEVWEDLLPEYIESLKYGEGGQTKFIPPGPGLGGFPNPLIPPVDGSTGPGVVVSQSYDAMQRELEDLRKQKLNAQKQAADAEAAREAQAREFATLNAQFVQYKVDAERLQTNQRSQIGDKTSAIEAKEADIQRQNSVLSQTLAERDQSRAGEAQKQNEINLLKECALDGLGTQRITVIMISYGTKVFYELGWTADPQGLVPKVESMISNGESLRVEDTWFGMDPNPGIRKQCVITYRFNAPGHARRNRTFCTAQHETGWFDKL